MAQKLSPQARRDKAARDKAYAMTPDRRKKKADSQRRRRAAGDAADGMDYDHKDGRWESPAQNRGNDGQGTKKAGKATYKVQWQG